MIKASTLKMLIAALFMLVATTSYAKESEKRTRLVLITTKGEMVCELFDEKAPKTCENFLGLAKKGYYNNTHFHRVIPGFMCQAGDPTGSGRGGDSLWGGTFKDEFHDSLQFSKKGLLAMANRGPNTNTSQFFITTAKTPWLNHKHTIFGRVLQGFSTLEAIEKCGSRSGSPSEKVIIKEIRLKPLLPKSQPLVEKKAAK